MEPIIVIGVFGILVVSVILSIPIAYAFILTASIGTFISIGTHEAALGLLSQTMFSDVREYVFVVLPMFTAMGTVIARSGAAKDIFVAANNSLSRLKGRLAVATIAGNAMFAAVTGVGIAAAAAFSRIAYPEMQRHGYRRDFASGTIAGSSVLGLLIPPSVFMIVWAILTEQSVGVLFIAGIGPGVLLTLLYASYVVVRVSLDPSLAPENHLSEEDTIQDYDRRSVFGILLLIIVVLGGIWIGFMTPTEASAVGLLMAKAFGLVKGMTFSDFVESFSDAGKMVTPLILLLIGAKMYSRFLALEGVPDLVQWTLEDSGLGPIGTILLMCGVWLLLGMLIDSVSIMLLTVPIFYPIANQIGMDPIAFALVGILVIEAGVLTPPFGLAAFVVKSSIQDQNLSIGDVFKGSFPYCLMILLVAVLVLLFPGIATWLPSLM